MSLIKTTSESNYCFMGSSCPEALEAHVGERIDGAHNAELSELGSSVERARSKRLCCVWSK